ncbi:MAG: hypothetical protein HRT36_04015 [Alphaproteobacteria bacterium]|nr:hypothetical protein [Alphaproteobacteria bacterium]
MSTTIVETWAVNMADLGPIYPFVGTEFILFIVGIVFWIGFHITQLRTENRLYDEERVRYQDKEILRKVLLGSDEEE